MSFPLKGITVLDLSRYLPGPYCTMILGELGANVIQIEDPNFPYHAFPPFFSSGREKKSVLNTILNRNKKSMSLDLKKKESLKIFYRLVSQADVLVEGFRPGKTERLGVDYHTLKEFNPSLIYCSLTGYGQDGVMASKAGHDINYVSISGNLGLKREGAKPIVPGVQMADISGSLFAVIAILGALLKRNSSDEKPGDYIDISMLDCAFSINPAALMHEFAGESGKNNILMGNHAYYNVYETKDGKFISVAAIEQKFWEQLCIGLEAPELKGKQQGNFQHQQKLMQILSEKFKTKSQREWIKIFENLEACVTPVLDYHEAINHPQILDRNLIKLYEDPLVGKIPYLSIPIKYFSSRLTPPGPSPIQGEHTHQILKELGFSGDEIAHFKEKGCFR